MALDEQLEGTVRLYDLNFSQTLAFSVFVNDPLVTIDIDQAEELSRDDAAKYKILLAGVEPLNGV